MVQSFLSSSLYSFLCAPGLPEMEPSVSRFILIVPYRTLVHDLKMYFPNYLDQMYSVASSYLLFYYCESDG